MSRKMPWMRRFGMAPELLGQLRGDDFGLQDRVPAFSVERVRGIIRAELGAGPEALFAAFDERPLAAASLGQVHRATLRDGSQVVVKVQRPGLKVRLSRERPG